MDEKIVHLVIWTKFDLEDDPASDDLTPKARKEVDDYVNKVFGSKMPLEHVCFSLCPRGSVFTSGRLFGSRTGDPLRVCMLWNTSMSCFMTQIQIL